MLIPRRLRSCGLIVILAAVPIFPLAAQSPPPTPPPSDSRIEPQLNPLIGLAVFASDGTKVGTIDSVDGEPDGRITAINVRTGGFLGFGTKVVAVPEGQFERTGSSVHVALTAEELSKLPAIKEQT
jgi:sporulation protein YlmC with PRC-barrel domain